MPSSRRSTATKDWKSLAEPSLISGGYTARLGFSGGSFATVEVSAASAGAAADASIDTRQAKDNTMARIDHEAKAAVCVVEVMIVILIGRLISS
jgi:hypothetical protein